MRYWDSSAVVPLVIVEEPTAAMEALIREDGSIATWWGTRVECASAIARRDRDGSLDRAEVALAVHKLAVLEAQWAEAVPTYRLRESARRLVRVHDVRAADALQLAAAIDVSRPDEQSVPFVTLDARLALAATREGFAVLSA